MDPYLRRVKNKIILQCDQGRKNKIIHYGKIAKPLRNKNNVNQDIIKFTTCQLEGVLEKQNNRPQWRSKLYFSLQFFLHLTTHRTFSLVFVIII